MLEEGTGQFLNLQTLEVCLAVIGGGAKVDAIMAHALEEFFNNLRRTREELQLEIRAHRDSCRAETFLLLVDAGIYNPQNEAILNSGRKSEVVLTVLGAVFLLVAASGRHSYGFYMVLRLITTVGAVYWAWRVYKVGLWGWAWAFAAVALLMNPLLPIRMQRTQWQPIDLGLGIFLFGWCAYWFVRKSR